MFWKNRVERGTVHSVQREGFEQSSNLRLAGRNIPHLNFILATPDGQFIDVLFKGSTRGTIGEGFEVEVEGIMRRGKLQALKITNIETSPPSVIAQK